MRIAKGIIPFAEGFGGEKPPRVLSSTLQEVLGMDSFWSNFVQTTEELYSSRSIRFREDNAQLWLEKIGVQPGMKVLEMGCGGGLFCHRIKKAVPQVDITGLDFDEGHIRYAQEKAEKLGLDCSFVCGDALDTPFEKGTFDLVYSYTVAEHLPPEAFLREQRRVLKDGGRLCVMSVRPRLNLRAEAPKSSPEEDVLWEKLWKDVPDIDAQRTVGAYSMNEREMARQVEAAGFKNVSVQIFTVMDFAPDSADISPEVAREMIEDKRTGMLEPMKKAMAQKPDNLTDKEKQQLLGFINAHVDERMAKYEAGEHLWDFTTSTVLTSSPKRRILPLSGS